VTHSGPEVLFQDLRRDEIRGWWWWWWHHQLHHQSSYTDISCVGPVTSASSLTFDIPRMRTRMGVRALVSSSSVWRWSSSAEVSFLRHPEAARATNTQQTWWQEFLGSRSSTVERSSIRTAAAGTFLPFFQTIFENTPLWRLKRLVTLSTYRRYINECMYVSIYLSRSLVLCARSLDTFKKRLKSHLFYAIYELYQLFYL